MTGSCDTASAVLLYFNPHPYVRDDSALRSNQYLTVDFNPHPYVRDDVFAGHAEDVAF